MGTYRRAVMRQLHSYCVFLLAILAATFAFSANANTADAKTQWAEFITTLQTYNAAAPTQHRARARRSSANYLQQPHQHSAKPLRLRQPAPHAQYWLAVLLLPP